jgi:hypothetical protein
MTFKNCLSVITEGKRKYVLRFAWAIFRTNKGRFTNSSLLVGTAVGEAAPLAA